MCIPYEIGDAETSQPVFVVVFSESTDAVLVELVGETGIWMGPPDGQNAHNEARVSARGGILKAQAMYRNLLLIQSEPSIGIKLRIMEESVMCETRCIYTFYYYGVIPKQRRR
jgi:hypothetical protein